MTARQDVANFDDAFARIAANGSAISDMNTDLVIVIDELEQALATHFRVRVELDLAGGRGFLVFAKLDGAWRLALRGTDPDDDVAAIGLLPSNEQVELFARGDVHRFVVAAADQLDAMVSRRREALEMAKTLLGALRGSRRG